jgi:hypothetical protein
MRARGHSLDALSELIESGAQLLVAVGSMGDVVATTGVKRQGGEVIQLLQLYVLPAVQGGDWVRLCSRRRSIICRARAS